MIVTCLYHNTNHSRDHLLTVGEGVGVGGGSPGGDARPLGEHVHWGMGHRAAAAESDAGGQKDARGAKTGDVAEPAGEVPAEINGGDAWRPGVGMSRAASPLEARRRGPEAMERFCGAPPPLPVRGGARSTEAPADAACLLPVPPFRRAPSAAEVAPPHPPMRGDVGPAGGRLTRFASCKSFRLSECHRPNRGWRRRQMRPAFRETRRGPCPRELARLWRRIVPQVIGRWSPRVCSARPGLVKRARAGRRPDPCPSPAHRRMSPRSRLAPCPCGFPRPARRGRERRQGGAAGHPRHSPLGAARGPSRRHGGRRPQQGWRPRNPP